MLDDILFLGGRGGSDFPSLGDNPPFLKSPELLNLRWPAPSLESMLALSRSWSLELEARWKALVLGGRGGGLGGGGTGGGVAVEPSSDLEIQNKCGYFSVVTCITSTQIVIL